MASEVGSAYFTLLPTVKGLQGSLAKEVAGVDGSGAGATLGKSVGGGMVGSIKSLVGPALAAISVGAVVNFAKNAVNSFSELEDSSAAATVTFGGNVDRITALSKTAAGSLGLSSQQVVNSAQMFGVFGKSAGLAGDDLQDFAIDMTKLSGDLSSFTGKSTEDAITAVGAAMRGEFEPIRSFGVLLDDATLRQEALSMGLISTTKDALTPQQKTLAAQSAILKQTTDAQGDFARTSQSTANVAKTLASESENLSAKFGSFLAPAFTAVRVKALAGVRGISGVLDKVTEFQGVLKAGGTNQELAASLGLKGDSVQRFSDFVGPFRAFTGAYKDGSAEVTSSGFAGVLEGLGGTLGRVHAGLTITGDDVRAIGGDLDPLIGKVFDLRTRFGDLVAGVGPKLGELAGQVGQSLAPAFQSLGPVFSALGPVFANLIPQVFQLITTFSPLGLIFKALLPVLPQLVSTLGLLAASLGLALSGALSAVLPMLTQLAGLLVQSLGQVFVAVVPVVVSMLAQLSVFFVQLAPVIANLVGVVVGLATTLLSQLLPVFLQLVTAVLPMVSSVFAALLPAIIPVVNLIAGLLVPVIQALLPVVVFVFQTVASVVQSVMQVVQGIIQVVTGVISGNWSQVWNGLGNILSGAFNFIVAVVRGALGLIGSVVIAGVQLAVSFFQNAFGALGGFLGGVFGGIVGTVSTGIGNVVNFFTGLPGRVVGALAGLGGQLASVGSQMMQGFVGGVQGMATEILNSAVNAVKGAVEGVKKFLGIASPSRLLRQLGRFTGQGYTLGVVDETKHSQEALKRLVTPPPPPAASLAAAGGRYAYDVESGTYRSGPLVEQKVYPSEKMSEQNLADVAAGKIVEELV